jgi:hypothetical protein
MQVEFIQLRKQRLTSVFYKTKLFLNQKTFVMANHQPHKEGKVAKMLEEQTAKVPSDVYLWAAVGTMAISLGCFLTRQKHASIFFGQWAPSLLIIGLYNKLVKTEGHDQEDKLEDEKAGKKSFKEGSPVL